MSKRNAVFDLTTERLTDQASELFLPQLTAITLSIYAITPDVHFHTVSNSQLIKLPETERFAHMYHLPSPMRFPKNHA